MMFGLKLGALRMMLSIKHVKRCKAEGGLTDWEVPNH